MEAGQGLAASLFVGIDVQMRRACPYCVLDAAGQFVQAGWLDRHDAPAHLRSLVERLQLRGKVAVGIDAPRTPLETPRRWSFSGGQWHESPRMGGAGRHCEVVVSALRLANPQWTGLAVAAPAWMKLGFSLYSVLEGEATVYEVFPSASYAQFAGGGSMLASVPLDQLRPGPKDMLDALVSAVTVREFVQGRGCEVGGGDGLGTIILPRSHGSPHHPSLQWPG